MRHLFTAGWLDDSADICALAAGAFDTWAAMKSGNSHGVLNVRRHTFHTAERACFRASLVETAADGRQQRTELGATSHRDRHEELPSGWFTVDVHGFETPDEDYVPAPWLVQELIRRGVRPRFGDDKLTVAPRVLCGSDGGETLADLVTDFRRRISLVVLSDVPDLFARVRRGPDTLADIAAETARSCAGLASVVLVDQACLAQYNAAVGRGHAVHEGCLRVFRAGADPAISGDAQRHPQRAAQSWYGEPAAGPNFACRIVVADAVSAARAAESAAVRRSPAGPDTGSRSEARPHLHGHTHVSVQRDEQSRPFNRP